jgi:photosystem II stability/assembly factor-like uncharacterized protein
MDSMKALAIVTRLAVLVAVVLPFADVDAADLAPDQVSTWIARMSDRFEANPEWKHQTGTGWKPYNRLKWFHEQRMVDGEEPPVGARWRAWEEKRRREGIRVLPYGSSWFSLGPANFAGRMLALAFDPTNSNVLYAGAASGGLWKSTDRGVTWTPITDSLPTLAVGGVAVLPSNPDIVIIGTGEGTLNVDRVGGVGILKSTNGGVTWNPTSLGYAVVQGHGFHFVRANPIRGTLLAGATDGLWRSSDDGDTWTRVSPPTSPDGNYYAAEWKPGHADSVFTCKGNAPGSNIKISTDDGLTWTRSGDSPGGNGKTKIAMSPNDPNTIYAIVVNQSGGAMKGVYRSTNAGVDWELRTTTPNMVGAQGWYNLSLAVDPNDASRVIAGGVPLYRSTNGGATFTQIGFNVHVDHHDIAYVPGSNSEVFVATDGGIWESTNDGGSWIDRNAGLVTYQFYDICVNNHTDVPDFLMGGTQDQGTDKWTGSTIWTGGLGGDGMVCNISPHNGETVYAEIQFGDHWKSTNSGSSWQQINNGIPDGRKQPVGRAGRPGSDPAPAPLHEPLLERHLQDHGLGGLVAERGVAHRHVDLGQPRGRHRGVDRGSEHPGVDGRRRHMDPGGAIPGLPRCGHEDPCAPHRRERCTRQLFGVRGRTSPRHADDRPRRVVAGCDRRPSR